MMIPWTLVTGIVVCLAVDHSSESQPLLPPHPFLKAYNQPVTNLKSEVYEALLTLGRSARVLLPYQRGDVLNASHGGNWKPRTKSDINQTFGRLITHNDITALTESRVANILSPGALAGIRQLVDRGWLRLARTRSLTMLFKWRLQGQEASKTLNNSSMLNETDLVMFMEKTAGSDEVYRAYEERLASGKQVPGVFAAIPAHREVYYYEQPPLWSNLTLLSYGRFDHKQDFMVPEVPFVVPFGPGKLAGTLLHSPGQSARRRLLLSFFGSINGSICDNHLGYMRMKPVNALAQMQSVMMRGERVYPRIAREMENNSIRKLFVTTNAELRSYKGLAHVRAQVKDPHHMGGAWDALPAVEVLTLLTIAAGSHFCFQPAGDEHLRHGIFDSWHMGCVPVIYDTSTELLGTLFGGLFFLSRVRMEDVVMIVSRQDVISNTSGFYLDLLASISDGRLARMRASIREMVDDTLYRLGDEQHHDALTLTLGVLRYRQELERRGEGIELPAITPNCIPLHLRA